MTTQPTPSKEMQLQIDLDDAVAQGSYCNLAMVNHTPAEFTIDFIYVQPQQPKARVRARVITSPQHMKRLIMAMQENFARFEKAFGSVEPSKIPDNLPVH